MEWKMREEKDKWRERGAARNGMKMKINAEEEKEKRRERRSERKWNGDEEEWVGR